MIVKVCGMRVAENIRQISETDVDFLGFIFWPESSRFVNQVRSRGGFIPDYSSFAKRVSELGGTPEFLKRVNKPKRVGIFLDDMPQTIVQRIYNFNLDMVQLHADESVVMIENLRRTVDPDIRPVEVIKTIYVDSPSDFDCCAEYAPVVDYFLFYPKGAEKDGTLKKIDWSLLDSYKGDVPFLLGGGIGPDDVDRLLAIRHPQFAGVDINVCFETEPGVKDIEQIKQFMNALGK